MKNRKVKKALGGLVFLAVFAGMAAIVMLLWNALIPGIIGWEAINYWQSAGLIVLCRLLLGGIGRMKPAGRFFGPHNFDPQARDQMKYMHEKMMDMPYQERREYIRKKMMNFNEATNFERREGGKTNSNTQPED